MDQMTKPHLLLLPLCTARCPQNICTHTHTHTNTYTHKHTRKLLLCTARCLQNICTHTQTHTNIHTRKLPLCTARCPQNKCTRTHTHTHANCPFAQHAALRTNVRAHTHTHTHTHKLLVVDRQLSTFLPVTHSGSDSEQLESAEPPGQDTGPSDQPPSSAAAPSHRTLPPLLADIPSRLQLLELFQMHVGAVLFVCSAMMWRCSSAMM